MINVDKIRADFENIANLIEKQNQEIMNCYSSDVMFLAMIQYLKLNQQLYSNNSLFVDLTARQIHELPVYKLYEETIKNLERIEKIQLIKLK